MYSTTTSLPMDGSGSHGGGIRSSLDPRGSAERRAARRDAGLASMGRPSGALHTSPAAVRAALEDEQFPFGRTKLATCGRMGGRSSALYHDAASAVAWLGARQPERTCRRIGIALPSLATPDKAMAKQVAGLHELAGTVILVLVGLHVLASLYHRYWLRDDVLASMLGRWVGPKSADRPGAPASPETSLRPCLAASTEHRGR
jgi:hypothetical protein